MRVIQTATHGTSLLANGDFETVPPQKSGEVSSSPSPPSKEVPGSAFSPSPPPRGGPGRGASEPQSKPASWVFWHQGFILAPGEGRNRSQCLLCQCDEGDRETGASQTLILNRTNIAPFIIRGWSKSENVTGSPDSGYSLYIDITYSDGTPLWGQTADFSCGTHDWEKRQFVLFPDKPVKALTIHCLFRGHTGKVWFDDVSLEEVPTPEGATLFQGLPLSGWSEPKSDSATPPRNFKTSDGLALATSDNTITSLQLHGRDV